jgi:hypothetical protein
VVARHGVEDDLVVCLADGAHPDAEAGIGDLWSDADDALVRKEPMTVMATAT